MSLKTATNKALERIGRSNGTAPPPSQDPMNSMLHEYAVCSIGASYFTKRRAAALDAIKNELNGMPANRKLVKATEAVAKSQLKDEIALVSTADYLLSVEIKTGGSYLDANALRVALLKIMPPTQVDALFDEASKVRTPSQSFKVTETGDQDD